MFRDITNVSFDYINVEVGSSFLLSLGKNFSVLSVAVKLLAEESHATASLPYMFRVRDYLMLHTNGP